MQVADTQITMALLRQKYFSPAYSYAYIRRGTNCILLRLNFPPRRYRILSANNAQIKQRPAAESAVFMPYRGVNVSVFSSLFLVIYSRYLRISKARARPFPEIFSENIPLRNSFRKGQRELHTRKRFLKTFSHDIYFEINKIKVYSLPLWNLLFHYTELT